jgi:hypothetical protein
MTTMPGQLSGVSVALLAGAFAVLFGAAAGQGPNSAPQSPARRRRRRMRQL